ncbi:hypothetical protein [uncultured Holdemanella sp.]|uniref:hypothetical protein n=1 Tax=uncultured Holdemanella sp. TaxID=1763549 RepID=UPI0025F3D4A5|nr:hypothetical protein [uncultured Holdemanella sp.]
MNLNHTVKVVGSVLLSAVMAGSMMPVTVFAQSNDENPTEKTETVYSVLNSDGSISDTIVSSWLHDEDGINNIKETLNLKDVKNIKSNEKPSKDGNTYTWNAKGNDVYYEGTATKQLPVSVKIRYELDGQEMSAKDMEGKSGHLKLTISFTNNYSQVKNINGKSIVIHPSYLAGGMLNMSTGKFSNVKCESGKIVNDGTNEMLAFANIPGLNETLKSAGLDKVNNQLGISDDVTVEADVNNFDLGSIMVGMTNEIDLASELGDIGSVSELTDGIDQLIEADDQLIDGSKQLYDGTTQLKEQAAPLTGSSDQVRQLSSGAIQLNDGVKALQTGITQYTAGASAINEGVNQLYGIPQGAAAISSGMNTKGKSGFSMVEASSTLRKGLNQLNSVAAGISAESYYNSLMDNVKTAEAGVTQLQNEVLAPTKTELGNLGDVLKKASSSLSGLSTLVGQLSSVEAAIEQDQATVSSNNEKVTANNNKIESVKETKNKLNEAIESLKTAREALKATETEENPVDTSDLDSKIASLENAYNSINVDDMQTLDGLTKFDEQLKAMPELLNNLKGTIDTVNGYMKSANESVGKLDGYLKTASAGLASMETLLNDSKGDMEKMQAMIPTLQRNIDQLDQLANGVDAGVQSVNENIGKLSSQSQSAVDTLKAGTTQLTSNNATLNGGASALSQATGTLAGQSGTFNEMADGLDTLGEAFETLNSGAKELYEGNEQFKSEGLDQLKEKVDLGVGELETLQSVMDEIKAMNKEYASYSGAPEGATVTSRYVFRTKEESSK